MGSFTGGIQDMQGSGRSFTGGIQDMAGGLSSKASAAGFKDLGNGYFVDMGQPYAAPITGSQMQHKLAARDFSVQQSNPANLIGNTNYLEQIQQYLNPGSSSASYGGGASGVATENPYEKRLAELVNNPNSISDTNAYKFRFNQGQQALERSAAAKGMLNSGNTLAELANYGQGAASQEYGNEFGRLAGMTGERNQYNLGLKGLANQEYGMRSNLDQNRAGVALSALTTANDQRLKANQLATATATGTNFVSPKVW